MNNQKYNLYIQLVSKKTLYIQLQCIPIKNHLAISKREKKVRHWNPYWLIHLSVAQENFIYNLARIQTHYKLQCNIMYGCILPQKLYAWKENVCMHLNMNAYRRINDSCHHHQCKNIGSHIENLTNWNINNI